MHQSTAYIAGRFFNATRFACHSPRSCAAKLRALRIVPPVVEQVAADAELFGDLSDGLASAQEIDGLCFELGGYRLRAARFMDFRFCRFLVQKSRAPHSDRFRCGGRGSNFLAGS